MILIYVNKQGCIKFCLTFPEALLFKKAKLLQVRYHPTFRHAKRAMIKIAQPVQRL